jgi:hypothetical protein
MHQSDKALTGIRRRKADTDRRAVVVDHDDGNTGRLFLGTAVERMRREV